MVAIVYTPNETTYYAPADRRGLVLSGVSADHVFGFRIRAYRKVDADIEPTGRIFSNIVSYMGYQPTTAPVYHGDIQGTIQGRDALLVVQNLENIASDSVLSTAEKPALILSYNQAQSDWTALHAKAQALGSVATQDNAASAAWTALTNYLNGLTPAWNLTTEHTPIVASTFQSKWASFYSAIADLQAAITGQKGDPGTPGTPGAPGDPGAPGPAGPTISLTADDLTFDFMDGVAFNSAQVITLTATKQNTTETLTWAATGSVALGTNGNANQRTISLSAFGGLSQVTVTVTGATSGASAAVTLVRNDQTTPTDSIIPDSAWIATAGPSGLLPTSPSGTIGSKGVVTTPWRFGGGMRVAAA